MTDNMANRTTAVRQLTELVMDLMKQQHIGDDAILFATGWLMGCAARMTSKPPGEDDAVMEGVIARFEHDPGGELEELRR